MGIGKHSPFKPEPLVQLVCLVFILLYLFFCGDVFLNLSQFSRDFASFFMAGKILAAGNSHLLYDLAVQLRYYPAHPDLFLPFFHPPFEALLFVGLTLFSYPVAYVLWNLCNLIFIILACRLFYSCYMGDSTDPEQRSSARSLSFLTVLLSFLAFFPAWLVFLNGQDSILFFLLIMGSIHLRAKGKELMAGLLLGCAVFKPQLALPIAVGLGFRSKRSLILGFLLSAAIWFAVSLALTGFKGGLEIVTLYRESASESESYGLHFDKMANLHGMLERWSSGQHRESINFLSSGLWFANMLLISYLNLRARLQNFLPDTRRFNRSLDTTTLLLTLLTSFHLNGHDLILLVAPLLLLVQSTIERIRLLPSRDNAVSYGLYLFVFLIFLFFATPLFPFLLFKKPDGVVLLQLGLLLISLQQILRKR